jgi:hypothetical protein
LRLEPVQRGRFRTCNCRQGFSSLPRTWSIRRQKTVLAASLGLPQDRFHETKSVDLFGRNRFSYTRGSIVFGATMGTYDSGACPSKSSVTVERAMAPIVIIAIRITPMWNHAKCGGSSTRKDCQSSKAAGCLRISALSLIGMHFIYSAARKLASTHRDDQSLALLQWSLEVQYPKEEAWITGCRPSRKKDKAKKRFPPRVAFLCKDFVFDKDSGKSWMGWVTLKVNGVGAVGTMLCSLGDYTVSSPAFGISQ